MTSTPAEQPAEQPSDPPGGRLSHPDSTPPVLRLLNPVFRALLLSPLHRPLSSTLGVLTVVGRRSGRTYRVVVAPHAEGPGTWRVWTGAGWRANFRGGDGHPATLRVHGRDTLVHGVLVEDRDVVVAAAHAFLAGGGSPRMLGLRLSGDGPVSVADVEGVVPPLSWVEFRERATLG